MTCSECQVQIFECELGSDAVAHLTTCEECRALDREVLLNAEALSAMRDDVIPVRRARRWPWVAAVAAAAVAAIGLSFWMTPYVGPIHHPDIVADLTPPPVIEAPVVPEIPRMILPKPAVVRRVRAAKRAVTEEQPLLVKFFTDDPEVVIYWLIDPIQGEQAL
ncbi:MAG: hypothetical protein ABIR70_06505 [Bryobacteraceae bacterium]